MTARLDRWRYVYQPLASPQSHIRLFKLLASEDPDVICCTLVFKSLDEPPLFIAGSYQWGEPDRDSYGCTQIDGKMA